MDCKHNRCGRTNTIYDPPASCTEKSRLDNVPDRQRLVVDQGRSRDVHVKHEPGSLIVIKASHIPVGSQGQSHGAYWYSGPWQQLSAALKPTAFVVLEVLPRDIDDYIYMTDKGVLIVERLILSRGT